MARDLFALEAMAALLDADRVRHDAVLEIVARPERLVRALVKAVAAMPEPVAVAPKQHRNLTKAYRRANGLLGKPGTGPAQ